MFGIKKKPGSETDSLSIVKSNHSEAGESFSDREITEIKNSGQNKLSKRKKLLLLGLVAIFALGALGAGIRMPGSGQSVLSTLAETGGLKEKTGNTSKDLLAPDPALQFSKEYIYAGSRMLAIEDYGLSSTPTPTPTATPATPTAPAAPTLSVISQSQINVYWNASPASENVTDYKLRINGTHLITGIAYTSFPATSLAPGTAYTFEVAAVNSSGVSSAWSPGATATTLSNAPAPGVPTGVSAQTYSSTQINVYWNASPQSENVTSYNLRIDGSQLLSGITYTSFPVTGLAPDTIHSFEVQAVNSGGASGWSSAVSAATTQPPSAPIISGTEVISSTQINLYWNASPSSENVTGYNVRMNGSQALTGFTYTSFPFTGLSPNTTYTFEVQAVDAAGGASAWSQSASATTTP